MTRKDISATFGVAGERRGAKKLEKNGSPPDFKWDGFNVHSRGICLVPCDIGKAFLVFSKHRKRVKGCPRGKRRK